LDSAENVWKGFGAVLGPPGHFGEGFWGCFETPGALGEGFGVVLGPSGHFGEGFGAALALQGILEKGCAAGLAPPGHLVGGPQTAQNLAQNAREAPKQPSNLAPNALKAPKQLQNLGEGLGAVNFGASRAFWGRFGASVAFLG
jgi:hypothetical protein